MRSRLRLPVRPAARPLLLAAFAVLYIGAVGLASFVSLRRAIGPRGYSPAGIGEAVARVPSYPADACAFIRSEGFPPGLRLLNNFEIGGYLMWRLPSEPVFIDGRLDVYAGATFDNNLILARDGGSPAWRALVRYYDFDCVMTTSAREAAPFESDPQWQLVYADPPRAGHMRCHILLRRRPRFAALIARCLQRRDMRANSPPA
jgi:hypothetical protein